MLDVAPLFWHHTCCMIQLKITDQEIEDLSEALDDPTTSEQIKLKLFALRMHHEGAKPGFIANVLNIHQNSVTNYLRQYRDGGLQAILENRYYRPSSALKPFTQCIKCSFQIQPVADAKEALARIKALSGIKISESQARRFMKSLGMKLRKSAAIPGKADPQLQFDFYTNELLPKLEEASKGQRKVFFVDAAHFVLGAFLGMLWCFSRVFVKTSPGRQRYNVLGAIDSHSHELVSIRTTDNINSLKVIELLDKLKASYPDTPISLVMDNARYQRAKLVQAHAVKLDIELVFLPAYSPNLNLIERLWKLTKKRCLTNRYYPDFLSFTTAIDTCLDDLQTTLKDELVSLMTLNFQFFQNHKT